MSELRFAPPLILALCAAHVHAADLLQIYRDALANDATYASARAARERRFGEPAAGPGADPATVNATAFTQETTPIFRFAARRRTPSVRAIPTAIP